MVTQGKNGVTYTGKRVILGRIRIGLLIEVVDFEDGRRFGIYITRSRDRIASRCVKVDSSSIQLVKVG